MAKKRVYSEEVDNLDEVKTATNLTVHGAVTAISPVKKGTRSIFFDGMLADNTSRLRMVGFNSVQQKQLQDVMLKNASDIHTQTNYCMPPVAPPTEA